MTKNYVDRDDNTIYSCDLLKVRLHELEQFMYGYTHDLKENLRTVSSFSQLLLRKNSDQFDAESIDYITHILRNIGHMNTLISDVLAYPKATDAIKPLKAIPLNALISDVKEMLAFQIEESKATITIGHLHTVYGDYIKVRQVFFNMMSNALKFRSEKPLCIDINTYHTGQFIKVSIKDNGIGINEEYHHVIFEPFKRLQPRSLEGSGIGLAICKKNVEAHGGTIFACTNPTGGTEFIFTLPGVNH